MYQKSAWKKSAGIVNFKWLRTMKKINNHSLWIKFWLHFENFHWNYLPSFSKKKCVSFQSSITWNSIYSSKWNKTMHHIFIWNLLNNEQTKRFFSGGSFGIALSRYFTYYVFSLYVIEESVVSRSNKGSIPVIYADQANGSNTCYKYWFLRVKFVKRL